MIHTNNVPDFDTYITDISDLRTKIQRHFNPRTEEELANLTLAVLTHRHTEILNQVLSDINQEAQKRNIILDDIQITIANRR